MLAVHVGVPVLDVELPLPVAVLFIVDIYSTCTCTVQNKSVKARTVLFIQTIASCSGCEHWSCQSKKAK